MPTPREQALKIGAESSNFVNASETDSPAEGMPQPQRERDYAAHTTNPKDPPPPARVSSK